MSALSDFQILDLIHSQKLKIEPLIADNVQPASVDLTLHEKINVLRGNDKDEPIDSQKFKDDATIYDEITIDKDGYILKPMQFVVAHSFEQIAMPQDVNGITLNRNSLAQIGIDVTASAYINPGFMGRKLIVVRNLGYRSVRLYAGMRICQLVMFKMGNVALRGYKERHDESKIIDYARGCVDTDVLIENEKHQIDTSLSDLLDKMLLKARQD